MQADSQETGQTVRKKKKAATKRKVLKVHGNTPMSNVYSISDISKSFQPPTLLPGDSDEEENLDQFSLKLSDRNKKKSKIPKSDGVEKSKAIDVEEIGSSPIGTPESSPSNNRKVSSPSPPPPPPMELDKANDRRLEKTVRSLDKAYHIAVNAQNWQSALTPSPVTQNYTRPDVDLDGSFDVHREHITVKVRTRHGLRRFEMDMYEPLIKIIIALAEEENVDVNTLSLTRSAEQLNEDDTPASLKLKVTDILDCVIIHPSSVPTEDISELVPDEDKVELKFQGQEKKSVFSIKVVKDEKLKRALESYSDFLKKPLDSLRFSFDGEEIGPMDTPEKLDMEEQGTIDVTIC